MKAEVSETAPLAEPENVKRFPVAMYLTIGQVDLPGREIQTQRKEMQGMDLTFCEGEGGKRTSPRPLRSREAVL